jgi:hypothetical protein
MFDSLPLWVVDAIPPAVQFALGVPFMLVVVTLAVLQFRDTRSARTASR